MYIKQDVPKSSRRQFIGTACVCLCLCYIGLHQVYFFSIMFEICPATRHDFLSKARWAVSREVDHIMMMTRLDGTSVFIKSSVRSKTFESKRVSRASQHIMSRQQHSQTGTRKNFSVNTLDSNTIDCSSDHNAMLPF